MMSPYKVCEMSVDVIVFVYLNFKDGRFSTEK